MCVCRRRAFGGWGEHEKEWCVVCPVGGGEALAHRDVCVCEHDEAGARRLRFQPIGNGGPMNAFE